MNTRFLMLVFSLLLVFSCKTPASGESAKLAGTNDKAKAFAKAISTIEKEGLKGTWLNASIWPNMPEQPIYVVDTLPSQVNVDSALVIQRTEPALAMAHSLIKEGMPLVLGLPPPGLANAMCILRGLTPAPEVVLATRKGTTAKANSIIVIGLDGDEFTLAHEAQHWRDYEPSASGDASNYEEIFHLVTQFGARLSDAEIDKIGDNVYLDLIQVVTEIRGHQAQLQLAYRRFEQKEPYFDSDSKSVTRFTSKSIAGYEQKVNLSDFRPNYEGKIMSARNIFAKHPEDRAATRKFFRELNKWDLLNGKKEPVPKFISLSVFFGSLADKS